MMRVTILAALVLAGSPAAVPAVDRTSTSTNPATETERRPSLTWRECLRQKPEWYGSADALRVAENVLLYQRASGGWPKNTEMASVLSDQEKAALLRQKPRQDSTIDNGATFSQMIYLARVHSAAGGGRYRDAFMKGLDYLLAAQYENGGWPQIYPEPTGYHRHITFNDGAMSGVMSLLRDIARKEAPYAFVDEKRRSRSEAAVRKGIDCILKCQIVVNGRRTAWCAQHDERTLAPAPARSYEKESLSGSESVGIVRFLMGIERPDARVIEAIEAAAAWFEQAKLTGIRLIEKQDPALPRGRDRVIIADPEAPPLWARFYELGTNRPIFSGRDGVIKDRLADIEHERRIGYAWYTRAPADLLARDYPEWKRKQVSRQAALSSSPPSGAVVFPGIAWPRKLPRELGMEAAALDRFAEQVGGDGCIVKDGYLVKTWGELTTKKDWASAAKPVLSTLLLFAVHEGKLSSVDARVEDAGWTLSPKDRPMTFRHLANMVSGYARGEPPGAAWAYNDFAINLYAQSLERVFGQPLDAVIRGRLAPLQFEDGSIFSSRSGRGVSTTPRDFARIGWFWLNRGRWQGRQLLPRRFFEEYVKVGVPADLPRTRTEGEDYLQVGSYGGPTDQTLHGPGVYGFNWWFNAPVGAEGARVWPSLPSDTFQANGHWNRHTVTIIPSLRMVVAVRDGRLGKFEPGRADGETNQTLKLIVDAMAGESLK